MPNLYTPPGGNTPQAQQTQNMTDVLAGITGSPAAGAMLASANTGPNYSQTNMPQLMSEEDKLRTMFANDQVLAQRYMNPNLYGGEATSPANNPAGQFASPLQATIDSITNPQGITSPGALIGAVGGDITGQKGTLENILNAIDFTGTRTLDQQKALLSALSTIYGEEQANKRAELQYGSDSAEKQDMADAYIEQIKGGMKLTSVPVNIRSAVVKRMKEMGLTMDKINKNLEGKPIIQNVSDLKNLWDKIPPITFRKGPLAKIIGGGKQLATLAGYEDALTTYNKKRDILISSLRQLVKQGGNMSNRDMTRIENGLAKITDVPEVSDQTWNEIYNTLSNTYGDDVVGENWTAPLPNQSSTTTSKYTVTPLP